jgi:hypothetical protein
MDHLMAMLVVEVAEAVEVSAAVVDAEVLEAFVVVGAVAVVAVVEAVVEIEVAEAALEIVGRVVPIRLCLRRLMLKIVEVH